METEFEVVQLTEFEVIIDLHPCKFDSFHLHSKWS